MKFLTAVLSIDETKRVKTFSMLIPTTWTEDAFATAIWCIVGKAAQHGLFGRVNHSETLMLGMNTHSTPPETSRGVSVTYPAIHMTIEDTYAAQKKSSNTFFSRQPLRLPCASSNPFPFSPLQDSQLRSAFLVTSGQRQRGCINFGGPFLSCLSTASHPERRARLKTASIITGVYLDLYLANWKIINGTA